MENWQKEHIRYNLVELTENIKCTDKLLDYLISHRSLTKTERSQIKECGQNEEVKSRELLDILETKISGYECLARTLYLCGQTGALLNLLSGVEANTTNCNAFKYCGIQLDTEQFLSMPVNFGGLTLPLGEICSNMSNLQNVIADNLNVTTFKQLISKKGAVITLDTIPKPLPYYIPRSISINSKLDEKFFYEVPSHVFLIEEIEWHHLTRLAAKQAGEQTQGKLTDISSNQLDNLTVRFILLEYSSHFAKIATKYQKIVHWIKYKNGAFYHVKTSGKRGISFVKKYLIRSDEKTVTQSYFVSSCLATSEQNIVVLYDSPGMGKTVLLSDLAREFKKLHPTSITVWMHCLDFLQMHVASSGIIPTIEKIKDKVTKMITVNKFGSVILQEILNTSEGKLYYFLDAFDELSSEEQQICISILKCIEECPNNLKVVITSRPHGAESLEALTDVLEYNILRFQESEQVLFFREYWNQQYSIKRTCALEKFARHCIKTFTEAVSPEEREVTGIPLQCRMLADIYADDAKTCNMYTSKIPRRYLMLREETEQLLDIVNKEKTKEKHPSKELLKTKTQTCASLLLQKEREAYLSRAGTAIPKNNLKESSSWKVAGIQMDTIDASQSQLLKEKYLEEVEKDRPLVINVELPKQDMTSYLEKNSHVISPDEENLALIINIKQFSTYEDANECIQNPHRDGSEHDQAYLRVLLPKLGFTIFRENEIDWERGNWTKEDVLDFVNAFQKHCTRRHPKAILIFIGSHGKFGCVYTSDSHELPEEKRTINLWEDVFSKFYDDNCIALKGKPKIFLVNACQVFKSVQSDNIYIEGPAVTDMLCCTAQVPGKKAYREPNSGSWFVHCIAFYLMKCAKEMDLMSIFNLANDALGCRKGVIASRKNKVESGQIATSWPLNLRKKIFILLRPN